MELVSFEFIAFVSAAVILYFIVPKKFRWVILLAASYVYYRLNSHWLLAVLFAASAVTFLAGLWIGSINRKGKQYLADNAASLDAAGKRAVKASVKRKAKAVLVPAVLIDLGMLLYLKYFNFFAGTVNRVLPGGMKLSAHELLLPLGISFYTLQALAYLFDVYRGKIEEDRNIFKFLLFMSWFPQILQGPIPRHAQLADQLYEGHDFSYSNLTSGIQLALWGYMKKMLIADRVATVVDWLFDNSASYSGLLIFFAAALYGLQVYADFSGGMDIARGISQIFGINLELNFNQPYFSCSVEEFWRRWHITLGAWMRDYVFYPLSLSRTFGKIGKLFRKLFGNFAGKRMPAFIAMFIVYFLVGLWHGPSLKYVAYGVWNGCFIAGSLLLNEVYEKLRGLCGIKLEDTGWKIFRMFRTFVICSFGRFFPRAVSLKQALRMMSSVFERFWDLSWVVDGTLTKTGLNVPNWFVLLAAVLVLFLVDLLHERNVPIRASIAAQVLPIRWFIYLAAIAVLVIFGIYGPSYNAAAFIYGQF